MSGQEWFWTVTVTAAVINKVAVTKTHQLMFSLLVLLLSPGCSNKNHVEGAITSASSSRHCVSFVCIPPVLVWRSVVHIVLCVRV